MDAWRAENAADYAQWRARKQKMDALLYGSRSAARASPLLMAVGLAVGLALGEAALARRPGRSSGSLAGFFGF